MRVFVTTAVWLSVVVSGLAGVWAYENGPGVDANAPHVWPASSVLARATDRPTLVFLAHPQCTCTRASLNQLAEALAHAADAAKTYVVFLRPSVFSEGWEKTGLWERAAAIPGVTVVRDDDGVEAERFGIETSGQTLLYDARGTMIFSGGITGARGHEGDNAGAAALVSFLKRGEADRRWTSVFGCPLFARSN